LVTGHRPEPRRIEAALKHGDERELLWALAFCEQRLRFARVKVGQARWRMLAREIRAALPQDADAD
jgi:hypothetical protein